MQNMQQRQFYFRGQDWKEIIYSWSWNKHMENGYIMRRVAYNPRYMLYVWEAFSLHTIDFTWLNVGH